MRLNGFLARFAATIFLAVLSALPHARAQVSASLKGVVTDPSGAAVASATVTAKNIETGAIPTSVTDDAGRYLVAALHVGEYEAWVAKAGFQDSIRSGLRS